MDEQAAIRFVMPEVAKTLEQIVAQMSVASKAVIKVQDDIKAIKERLYELETKGEY